MQNILLKSLTVSEYNVRKTDRNNGLEELIASIKAHGLLENLIVIQDNDNFEVIAGGKRLAALHKLQKDGELPDDYEVPCELVDTRNAEEISLAENAVRSQMHPADQFEAWAKLVDQGMSSGDIAARFGISDSLVGQRLKLGRVSPELMEAYRNDQLNLEALMAFTLTDDHKKQIELFNRIKDSWEIDNPRNIKNALTETSIRGNNCMARFVGIDVYEQAGGEIRRDLFGEDNDCYLDDIPLLEKLAEEMLQKKADEIKDKWRWVETRLEFGYEEKSKYQDIFPYSIIDASDEETARKEELDEKLEKMDEDGDDESEEYETCQKELQEIEERFSGFAEEDYEIGGCIVTIGYDGDYNIVEGLVRPEDISELFGKGDSSNTTPTAPVKEKSRYSQALTDRLKNYRLHSIKTAMANDFDTAFDSALYVMCAKNFSNYRFSETWLNVNAAEYYYPPSLTTEDETCSTIQENEEKLFSTLPLSWLEINDAKERFETFCQLTKNQKQELFSACIAKSLQPQLSCEQYISPIFEAISEKMNVDVTKHWKPTDDNFFNRVTKAELLGIGEKIFGEHWSKKYQKKTKGMVVTILHDAFNKPENKQFTEEQLEKLAKWLPEGMA